MKKFLFLLVAVAVSLTACTPGGEFDYDNTTPPNEQPGNNDSPDNPGDSQGGGNTTDPNNPLNNLTCAPNEILYTTKYGLVIELGNRQGFGGNLVYNTYEDGVGRLTFGNDVTTIPENAFKGCNSMEYIKMPETVTLIQKNAFDDCTGLKSFTVPESISDIELGAFDNCTGELIVQSEFTGCSWIMSETSPFAGSRFTKLLIDENVEYIPPFAFYGCEYIMSATILCSEFSVGNGAFSNCRRLTTFNSSAASADKRCLLMGNGNILFSFAPGGISEYEISDNITTIAWNAFMGCSGVTLTIPESVTDIWSGAFRDFNGGLIMNSKTVVETDYIYDDYTTNSSSSWLYGSKSTILIIGNNITKIGDNSFRGCTSLTSVIIPDSVTSIGDYAFNDCTSLKEVYCEPTTPPIIGINVFANNATARVIYVPESSKMEYHIGTNWVDYKTYIICKGEEPLRIGDLVVQDGTQGVVFYVSDSKVKIVSVAQVSEKNWRAVYDWFAGEYTGWHLPLGWKLPSLDELKLIYNNKSAIDSTLYANGYTSFGTDCYWAYSDNNRYYASIFDFGNGNWKYLEGYDAQWNTFANLRVILAF